MILFVTRTHRPLDLSAPERLVGVRGRLGEVSNGRTGTTRELNHSDRKHSLTVGIWILLQRMFSEGVCVSLSFTMRNYDLLSHYSIRSWLFSVTTQFYVQPLKVSLSNQFITLLVRFNKSLLFSNLLNNVKFLLEDHYEFWKVSITKVYYFQSNTIRSNITPCKFLS